MFKGTVFLMASRSMLKAARAGIVQPPRQMRRPQSKRHRAAALRLLRAHAELAAAKRAAAGMRM